MNDPENPPENTGTEALTPNGYSEAALIDWPREDLARLDHSRLEATSPHTLARVIERWEVEERRAVLRLLPVTHVADVLAEMHEEPAAETLAAMREHRAVQILDDFEPDDAADIVAELDDDARDRLMAAMPQASRESVETLLEYAPDTAGGIMTTSVDTAYDDMRIDEAIERIRDFAEDYEDLHYVYVTDREGTLKGAVSLRKLIQAQPEQSLQEVMQPQLRGVIHAEADQEEVARLMAEHNLPDIAVVDGQQRLLGVVTHDDVLDVINEEATEDLQILSGAGGDESLTDAVFYSVRRRGPWLVVNLCTALVAAWVITLFEQEIAALPILAALMPVIAAVGGNSGQQALAVAIRSIAMGRVQPREATTVLRKQMMVGLINGVGVGLIAACIVPLFGGSVLLAGVVLMAMLANMVLAGLAGAFIPLLLKQLNFDPAQSASILLTTVTDTAGFLIFLGLGAWLLL